MPVFKVKARKLQEWDLLINAKNSLQAKDIAEKQIQQNPNFYTPRQVTVTIGQAELVLETPLLEPTYPELPDDAA